MVCIQILKIYPFIHSWYKNLPNISSVVCSVQSTGDTAINESGLISSSEAQGIHRMKYAEDVIGKFRDKGNPLCFPC